MSVILLQFPIVEHLPNQIRRLREARGMSQQALADEIHVTKMTVSQLERGSMQLSLDYMRRIAHIFGLTPVDLLNEQDQNEFLRAEEMELIRRYRLADPIQREMIARVAEPRAEFTSADEVPDGPDPLLQDGATTRRAA